MLALKSMVEEVDEYAEAEAALRALADEYPAYASADVAEMKRHLAELESRLTDAARAGAALFAVAHNVKGQGASFGYELMTLLGEALCERLRHDSAPGSAAIPVLRALVGGCEAVLREKITGDGGERGRDILAAAGLEAPGS